jgi:hypothetical protein
MLEQLVKLRSGVHKLYILPLTTAMISARVVDPACSCSSISAGAFIALTAFASTSSNRAVRVGRRVAACLTRRLDLFSRWLAGELKKNPGLRTNIDHSMTMSGKCQDGDGDSLHGERPH